MDALEPLVKDQNKNLPTSLFTTKGKHFWYQLRSSHSTWKCKTNGCF
jgi:hypothetical protein